MQKERETRKEAAATLLKRATNGPFFSGVSQDARAEATRVYQLWAETWVVPLLHRLVPELREKT